MTENLLKNIVHYATSHKDYLSNATIEFFGEDEPKDFIPLNDMVDRLFLEWFIFDYKDENGSTFVKKYMEKNPNKLSNKVLDEIKQIFETGSYQMFQIEGVEAGNIVNFYGLEAGKVYKVKDYNFSKNLAGNNSGGCIFARIAKINGTWNMVGADTLKLPIEFTKRMKKILKGKKHTPIHTLTVIKGNIKTRA